MIIKEKPNQNEKTRKDLYRLKRNFWKKNSGINI